MASDEGPHLRRARTLTRLIGAPVGMVAGIFYGGFVLSNYPNLFTDNQRVALATFAGVAGAATFALAAPIVTVQPFVWLQRMLDDAPASEVIGAVAGLTVGLLISALVAILLSPLPYGIGFLASVALACCLVYVGVRTGTRRRDAFAEALRRPRSALGDVPELDPQDGVPIVVDTSVLIDGRIADVVATGFIQGRLLLAGFVLEELQRVADSADGLRRSRGRRGLAVVEALQQQEHVICEVVDRDFPGTPEVDSRLIKLARARGAAIITNDFNLNRLATIEGVRVLNLNDLANALKPIAVAGEQIEVMIVKGGKELHQGVGYLEDGTMVVVEQGRPHIDETVGVTVTSVLQTAAGRMIFAALSSEPKRESGSRPSRQSGAANR
jgi:uncharacterized protein YacL